jgi:hypothetical protein
VLSAYAILFALILLSAWVFVPGAYFRTTLKLGGGGIPSPPLPVRALLGLRIVRNLPARIIGFGIWPVHVRP